MGDDIKEIYHEQQSLQLCALHALNNIFQGKLFVKSDLDEICLHLTPQTWFNPHKSSLGLGNYDINVIMSALQKKGMETIWFDKRRSLKSILFDKVFGLILNVPSKYKLLGFVRLPLNQKHWITVRWIESRKAYYNLDSDLKVPIEIGSAEDLEDFLQEELASPDKELMVVVAKDVAESQSWKRTE